MNNIPPKRNVARSDGYWNEEFQMSEHGQGPLAMSKLMQLVINVFPHCWSRMQECIANADAHAYWNE